MSYIQCKQVVKAYKASGHEIVALRGIDFSMTRGEMVAIIGPSGAGKSSLMNLIGGLDKPTAGQVYVEGGNVAELRGTALADYRLRRVGFVWQQIERNLLVHRTAQGNVALPMMLAGIPPRQRMARARDLLEAVGLAEAAQRTVGQLSGGQQQRAAIAVALANRPQILLADEPTGALDRKTAAQVMALLDELRRQFNLTVLLVTHDMDVARHADRVLTLRDGALGQALTGEEAGDHGLTLREDGALPLPEAVRQALNGPRIAVEVRPEGVLLRPEQNEETDDHGILQDAAPKAQRSWMARLRGKR
jgi:ABC-type lipoprotein export system ATPase subunit